MGYKFKAKNVIDSLTCYSFDYRNNDSLECIETLYLDIILKIPVKLNGALLKPDERGVILSKIHESQLLEIKKKRNIFGKATLVITTNDEH